MQLYPFSFSNIIDFKLLKQFATDCSLFCALSFKYQRPEGHMVPFGQCLFTLGCWQGKYWLQTFIPHPLPPPPPTPLLPSFADKFHTVTEQVPMGVLILSDHFWLLSDLQLTHFRFDPSEAEATVFFLVFLLKS